VPVGDKSKVILRVQAEGGSLALLAARTIEGEWCFKLRRNEVALFDLLPEEELGTNSVSDSAPVFSWPEALNLLNRYASWHRFHPVTIHPEFEDCILDAIRDRGGEGDAQLWLRLLRQQE
jgi:hypothetical protein